jgi:hypothetical protein
MRDSSEPILVVTPWPGEIIEMAESKATEGTRGTENRGIPGDGPQTAGSQHAPLSWELVRQAAVLGSILGVRKGLATSVQVINPLAVSQVDRDQTESLRLLDRGDYERAYEVATGFQDYFDINRRGKEIGSGTGEQAAVMMGHATGFNQAVQALEGTNLTGDKMSLGDQISMGIDAAVRLANTVAIVSGGVGAASTSVSRGLPFSAERALNNAIAEDAKLPILSREPEPRIKSSAGGITDVTRGLATDQSKPALPAKSKIPLEIPPNRPIDPLDTELASTESRLNAERAQVAAVKSSMSPQNWNNARAGLTKRLYNLLERRAALMRAKIWPQKKFLDQARVLGVEVKGKLTATNQISKSGKGRIVDIAEISSDKGVLRAVTEDLKSSSTQLKSIKGGLTAPTVEAEFRSTAEIAKQQKVEADVIKFAKQKGGKVVISGTNVRTGAVERIAVDPSNISSRVSDYDSMPGM